MKKLILFATLLGACASLMAQTPAPGVPFAPAYISAGAGLDSSSGANQGYGYVAYAKKTGLFNGSTNFPVYWYSEATAYSFQAVKSVFGATQATTAQATDFTTGFLYPFYVRKLAGFNVILGVDGHVGPTVAGPNVGYTIGAKAIASISRDSWKHWGIVVSVSPSKSSVTGTRLNQYSIGPSYSFNGF